MKLGKVTISCLVIAVMLTAGIVIVQAAGFISYEDGNKIAIWDNVRLINYGLKMSTSGVGDQETVSGGNVKIMSKDIFVRGMLGFECAGYPDVKECQAAIGNIGNAFLSMDKISSDADLTLTSNNTNINLITRTGNPVIINGKLIIKNGNNLWVRDAPDTAADTYSIYVRDIFTSQLWNSGRIDNGQLVGLNFPDIKFDTNPTEETSSSQPIIFYPKRLIKINLTTSRNFQ